jgi:hypothetical protein
MRRHQVNVLLQNIDELMVDDHNGLVDIRVSDNCAHRLEHIFHRPKSLAWLEHSRERIPVSRIGCTSCGRLAGRIKASFLEVICVLKKFL